MTESDGIPIAGTQPAINWIKASEELEKKNAILDQRISEYQSKLIEKQGRLDTVTEWIHENWEVEIVRELADTLGIDPPTTDYEATVTIKVEVTATNVPNNITDDMISERITDELSIAASIYASGENGDYEVEDYDIWDVTVTEQ